MADTTGSATPPPAPTSDNASYTPVARIGSIPAGQGRVYEVAGRLVAIFFDGTSYFAIDDLCPHMGASLGSGPLADGMVTCPWHAWRFRLRDGAWCDNPKLKVEVFPLRIDGDTILVSVPPAASAAVASPAPPR